MRKKKYTYVVSSETKFRRELALDLINAGIELGEAKLFRSFTAASAKLDEKQIKKLEEKGYKVEKAGPVPEPTYFP